jgi:tetratricopeptide (TPR) repeat protein
MAGPVVAAKIAEDPDGIAGYWFGVQLRGVRKDWEGVLEVTGRALAHLPDDETLMQMRGRAYHELGDHARATAWFNRAIGAKPSFTGARVDLGRLYEKAGELELAEEVFREIPVANPDYAMGPMSLALFLTRQGRVDEAEGVFLETWPRLDVRYQGAVRANDEAKPLFERPAIRDLVGAGATTTA